MSNLELFKAIAVAKLEFDKVIAAKEVSMGKFKFSYAEHEDILEAITPALTNHGLVLISRLDFKENRLCVVTMIAHESGQSIESFFPLAENQEPMELGKAISFGRRYNVNCLLEIPVINPKDPIKQKEELRKITYEASKQARNESVKNDLPKNNFAKPVNIPPVNAPTGLYPQNNKAIKTLIQILLIDSDRVDAYLQKVYPGTSADELDQDKMHKLIKVMASAYAREKNNEEAIAGIDGRIIAQLNMGIPLEQAINNWLEGYFTAKTW